MEKTKTNRGFNIVRFTDSYGAICSLQKSSLATENTDCIINNEIKGVLYARYGTINRQNKR